MVALTFYLHCNVFIKHGLGNIMLLVTTLCLTNLFGDGERTYAKYTPTPSLNVYRSIHIYRDKWGNSIVIKHVCNGERRRE